MTDVNGKATGWQADFEGGQWVITEKVILKKPRLKESWPLKEK